MRWNQLSVRGRSVTIQASGAGPVEGNRNDAGMMPTIACGSLSNTIVQFPGCSDPPVRRRQKPSLTTAVRTGSAAVNVRPASGLTPRRSNSARSAVTATTRSAPSGACRFFVTVPYATIRSKDRLCSR